MTRWGAHLGPAAVMVNERTKHCFLLVPRCASTSLYLLPEYEHRDGWAKPAGWTTTMVVRDPFDRLVSALSLNETPVQDWLDGKTALDPHFLPQSWFIHRQNPVDEYRHITVLGGECLRPTPLPQRSATAASLRPYEDRVRLAYHLDYRLPGVS
jgi:hypothetical protein